MPLGPDGSLRLITSSAKDFKNNIVILRVPENELQDNNGFPYKLFHVGAEEQESESPSEKSDEEPDDKEIQDIKQSMMNDDRNKNNHKYKTSDENEVRNKETVGNVFDRKPHSNINKWPNDGRRGRFNHNNFTGNRNYNTSFNTAKSHKSNTSVKNISPWLSPNGPQLYQNQNYVGFPQFSQSTVPPHIQTNTNHDVSSKSMGLLGDSPYSSVHPQFLQINQNNSFPAQKHWNNEYYHHDYQRPIPPANSLDRSIPIKQNHLQDFQRHAPSNSYEEMDGPVSMEQNHLHDYRPIPNNSYDEQDGPVSMKQNHPHDYIPIPNNSYDEQDGLVSIKQNHSIDYRHIHPNNSYETIDEPVGMKQNHPLDYRPAPPNNSYDEINKTISMKQNHPHDYRPIPPNNSFESLDGPVSMKQNYPHDYRPIPPNNSYEVLDGSVSIKQNLPPHYRHISSNNSYEAIDGLVSIKQNHPDYRPISSINSYETIDGPISRKQNHSYDHNYRPLTPTNPYAAIEEPVSMKPNHPHYKPIPPNSSYKAIDRPVSMDQDQKKSNLHYGNKYWNSKHGKNLYKWNRNSRRRKNREERRNTPGHYNQF